MCPYCDGWEVRDRRIGVLATGPRSMHQVQLLRQWSPDVTFFTNGGGARRTTRSRRSARAASPSNVARVGERRGADERAGSAASASPTATASQVDSIFLGPRFVPNDALLPGLGAADRPRGFGDGTWVDGRRRRAARACPGVWAAGNVVNPGPRVPVAAGAGNLAGAAINADLIEEEIRDALASAVTSPALTPRS